MFTRSSAFWFVGLSTSKYSLTFLYNQNYLYIIYVLNFYKIKNIFEYFTWDVVAPSTHQLHRQLDVFHSQDNSHLYKQLGMKERYSFE